MWSVCLWVRGMKSCACFHYPCPSPWIDLFFQVHSHKKTRPSLLHVNFPGSPTACLFTVISSRIYFSMCISGAVAVVHCATVLCCWWGAVLGSVEFPRICKQAADCPLFRTIWCRDSCHLQCPRNRGRLTCVCKEGKISCPWQFLTVVLTYWA